MQISPFWPHKMVALRCSLGAVGRKIAFICVIGHLNVFDHYADDARQQSRIMLNSTTDL